MVRIRYSTDTVWHGAGTVGIRTARIRYDALARACVCLGGGLLNPVAAAKTIPH